MGTPKKPHRPKNPLPRSRKAKKIIVTPPMGMEFRSEAELRDIVLSTLRAIGFGWVQGVEFEYGFRHIPNWRISRITSHAPGSFAVVKINNQPEVMSLQRRYALVLGSKSK